MRTKVLAVAFNPSLDKTVCVDRWIRGQEMRCQESVVRPGGKAINVARTLRLLDVDAGVWGVAAGVAGHKLASLLKAEGLEQEWCWTEGETRTNLTVLEQASGRVTRILEPGPRTAAAFCRKASGSFAKYLRCLNAVVFSGSLPPGMPPSTLAGFIRSARQANVLTALDASRAALSAGLRARPFLVKPNRDEAEEFCGFPIRTRAGIIKALGCLAQHSNIVLISLGKDGLAGSDGVRMFWARGPVVRQGATVGCGDAALAGFLSGFLKGDVMENCMRLAVACGTANVGASLPGSAGRRQVNDIYKRVKVERL
ncbi:MAG: 1-phosphofructokinase family hexose kinase [Candidatus Omnitrophica bacterium]|nr:1-phosphofructokinase family hexose kinase [Candidatus Omnitrophota bacterium]